MREPKKITTEDMLAFIMDMYWVYIGDPDDVWADFEEEVLPEHKEMIEAIRACLGKSELIPKERRICNETDKA